SFLSPLSDGSFTGEFFCKFSEKGGTMRNPFIISAFSAAYPKKKQKKKHPQKRVLPFLPFKAFSYRCDGI
ncbi:hypothetical protein, partial [Anaerotignum faecicola]